VPLVALPVSVPAVEPVLLDPVVDPSDDALLAPLPIRALVSTNARPLALVPDELEEPVVDPAVLPVVPTAPPIWLPCCRHPLIVIVSALPLVD
jgi:hypothetical protein